MPESAEAGNGRAHEYVTGRIEEVNRNILSIRTDAGEQVLAKITSPAGPGPMFAVGNRWRFGLAQDLTVVSFGDAEQKAE